MSGRSLLSRALNAGEVIPDRDKVRRVLLKKFKNDIINNRVLFRNIAKIARVEKVGGDRTAAVKALKKLFEDNDYSIEQAFESSVGEAYAERDLGTRIQGLLGLLDGIELDELDASIRDQLRELTERVVDLLGSEI